ncbi:5-bromo-4-chloroindolyl phosphate hydrolysis protein [Tritonibacter multivorans]|uniref:5-bromo-4-chloroindolyl phosphate hydrolysis protein n=1 Tax=Tritonibacter multivorans TaxID=928856 RepID=A0A0P1GHG9_9RHOB|nr:5-bromo-4-chloroindolyl phosphate hydrolysis family protein [Tritonibacter multivorans]MDA7420756.1 5-bromo-4-chloroindolyl phosphate hydrolysis family protein [Tritonibacter multivorans]CUH81021.1 5-bromo-4-chloroindolyl phosphate hydrolysis protein [Tritonibacter multivorans]SFC25596.1 5-bromo-4-chloroindolyl phosphate hydrolysis protein [Tritonibacter multivorans]
MAQRFGGKYSPSGQKPEKGTPSAGPMNTARVTPVGLRANLMFVPAGVLLLSSVFSGAGAMALGLIGAGVWTGGAVMLREGLKAEAAYNDRKVARRPALPRKILAAVLAAVGAALAALSAGSEPLLTPLYALAVGGLHLAAFGMDPLKNKGTEGLDAFQSSRVARIVDEAEAHLASMADAVKRARDRQVEARVEQFQATVRTMARTVEEDPRDLTAARKYLTVYLLGARDATVKFADIYARSQDAQARADYLALLDDLQSNFATKTETLLIEDRSDLGIEIDVLRERLEREGVHLDRNL